MQRILTILFAILLVGCAGAAWADVCAICGQEIRGPAYFVTDQVTGERVEVCSDCIKLPRCFICGLPVKDGVQLSDGRWLCARDAKTAVLDIAGVQSTFSDVHDDLDKLFARFTTFPTNVDVMVIDRIDVDNMFSTGGNAYESPDVLGITQAYTTNDVKRYHIGLLTGQPVTQLREVCAHELSHAWVGENVPAERHARIDRDAEEGFCEMMGYLLMDSEGQEDEKKRVMVNAYTRGQVKLFVAAEQEYGFDEILDWMQYGVTSRLEDGHLDEVRDIKMPAGVAPGRGPAMASATYARPYVPPPAPTTLQLQGVMWGSMPSAIINGKSFFTGDEASVRVGPAQVTIRCIKILQNAVQIQDVNSGQAQELRLSGK
jgi:hypothetical protein